MSGISEWVGQKRREFQERQLQKQQVKDAEEQALQAARIAAQQEAARINQEKEDKRIQNLLEKEKQKEIERLTTTKGERLIAGAQKVGAALQKGGQFAADRTSQLGGEASQLGRDLGKTFSPTQPTKAKKIKSGPIAQIGTINPVAGVTPQRQRPIQSIVSQDNTKTPIGDKIFGNTFTQNKKTVGGFSKDNFKKFL